MRPLTSLSLIHLIVLLLFPGLVRAGDPEMYTREEWRQMEKRGEYICNNTEEIYRSAIEDAGNPYEAFGNFGQIWTEVRGSAGMLRVTGECYSSVEDRAYHLLQEAILKGGQSHPREYMEMVCGYGGPVYRAVGMMASGPLDAYKKYKAIRMKVDSLKNRYSDYRHRAYQCVGGMLGLEGQLLDNYLKTMDQMKEKGYESGKDFVYSEYRQEQMKERQKYFHRALELDLQQPPENRLTEEELAVIGMGIYANPGHVEALVRSRIEDVSDKAIVGAGTEHPVSKERYIIDQLRWAATVYAQHGRFDKAEQLINEISQYSREGSEMAIALREDLSDARQSWPQRTASRKAEIEKIQKQTKGLQPIIWSVAELGDEEVVQEWSTSVAKVGVSSTEDTALQPINTSENIQNREGETGVSENSSVSGEQHHWVYFFLGISVFLLLYGVFWAKKLRSRD